MRRLSAILPWLLTHDKGKVIRPFHLTAALRARDFPLPGHNSPALAALRPSAVQRKWPRTRMCCIHVCMYWHPWVA